MRHVLGGTLLNTNLKDYTEMAALLVQFRGGILYLLRHPYQLKVLERKYIIAGFRKASQVEVRTNLHAGKTL